MSDLRHALDDYLTTRRALGFKLVRDGKLLPDFIDHLARCGTAYVTTAAALSWATKPRDVHPAWWTARLVIVRGFAKYLQAFDPRTEVPPIELLPHHRPRQIPYIYSPAEIAALLAATQTILTPFKAVTYKTLIGLLAVTGLRAGEAIALDDGDVDLRLGVIVVRKGKLGKSREVALHTTTVQALSAYARDRERLFRRQTFRSFFLSTNGRRLFYQNVHETFLRLVYAAGIAERRPRRPRVHDLRHTFAVRTVLEWHRAGLDVEARLPLLSAYLGHVSPSSTYWYLSAVPELLGAATARLERVLMKERP